MINKYGEKQAGVLCYCLILLASLILSCMFYYVALGEIVIVDVLAIMFFAAVTSPALLVICIQALKELEASRAYLDTATQQEKLLNQSLKDNIKQWIGCSRNI